MNRSTFNNVNRMGNGWHNNYMGYHSGWVHGYWNGHYPGGFGWRPYGYGYGYPGSAATAVTAAMAGSAVWAAASAWAWEWGSVGAFLLDDGPDALQLGLLELLQSVLRRRTTAAEMPWSRSSRSSTTTLSRSIPRRPRPIRPSPIRR